MIITHAAPRHGLDISSEPVDLARVALKRVGLIGKDTGRDGRAATDALNRLFRCYEGNERLTLADHTHRDIAGGQGGAA